MDTEKIDLNLLRIFDALMRTKNVTLAGDIVGLSQPAVSFALNKLRKLTDDPLFVRTPKGMEPTPRATWMADPIRHVLEVVERDIFLRETFDPAKSERSFTLSLTDIGEIVFLPPLLKRLKIEAPGIVLETQSMPPAKLAEAMAAGEVDLAVGYYPDITKANFYRQHLFSHSFASVVRKDHPEIGAKPTRRQFLDASHLVVKAEGRSQELFERFLMQEGIVRKIGLSVPHFLSILHLLPGSDMIATVPFSCARAFEKLGTLRMVELPLQVPTFDLKQHWHARYHRDPANQWLRKVVYECFCNGLD